MRKRAFYGFGHWINNVEREVKIADSISIGEALRELRKLLGYEPVRVVEKYVAHGWFYTRTYRGDGTLCKKTRWKYGTNKEVEEAFYSSDVEKAGLTTGVYYPKSEVSGIYV